MDKDEIIKKIDKNRYLIEQALSSDLDLYLLAKVVNTLKKQNDKLIKQLNE